jgi:Transposase and inactivated derivatives
MNIETEIAGLKAEIQQLRAQNQWLLYQLKIAQRQRFGASSEKNELVDGEQLSLFNEAEVEANLVAVEPELKDITAYRRRKAGQVGLSRLPKDLPIEIVLHELPPNEQSCSECGNPLHVMAHEERDELKFVPAKAVIVRHERYTYSCRCCEKHSDHVPVVKAPMPKPVIKGSFAAPEAIAHIAYEKFVMGSPLYRQEQDWARKGIPLSRQTMSNWLIRATRDWLFPVYDALREQLLTHEVLHGDETTVQVLKEPGKKSQSKSYMWLYRTSCDAAHPIVLYDYQYSRKIEHAEKFLTNFSGFLHADGYEGYHKLSDKISVVGCWAHARRKFDEALKVVPSSARAETSPMEAVRLIGELYKQEKDFKELPDDDNFKSRFEARTQRSKPLVEAFFDWCEKQKAIPKSHFGIAVTYALRQRRWLETYLLDGRLEIDNNRAERSIKPFVIGRKNWLFANTPEGARTSAVLYSLIETAKECKINPFDYLTFVFRNAPNLDLSNPDSVQKLLPWNCTTPAAL